MDSLAHVLDALEVERTVYQGKEMDNCDRQL